MKLNKPTLNRTRLLCLTVILTLSFQSIKAQYIIDEVSAKKTVSLHEHASIAFAGNKNYNINEVLNSKALLFKPLLENQDLGFTNEHYWVKFQLHNASESDIVPFIETCRPIVDVAELYIIRKNKEIEVLKSGDAIPFAKRNLNNRKTLFRMVLEPQATTTFYLHLKSDGETINVPIILRSADHELEKVSFEQNIFGFFYGILILAAIVYIFFFFGMKEQSFLYYGLYVLFIGLLQFSVDGYFYQYIAPDGGWLTEHCVLLTATFANFFLGMYAFTFLKIQKFSKLLSKMFYTLFALDFLALLTIIFLKDHHFQYPFANALGLLLLVLIVSSISLIYVRTKKIDLFFTLGILFLITGFVVFIMKNFGILPSVFWTDNSSKLGTGIEVIFLSLSMANLIRNLKNEREHLQELALQRSEEMNELKSYFLSNISHELRTPLNAILTTAKTIAKDSTEKHVQDGSQIIKYSTYSLLSSVNDILDFSKIEKNEIKLEYSNFDLVKTVEHIANNFAREAEDKGLDFSFQKSEDLPEMVDGDSERLNQILHNILSNAIKFTNEGFIKFKLEAQKQKDNHVLMTFTVSDTGIGISKDRINSIYDSFSQESINNKRKFGGLGLGLYIVKHLVNLHKGQIKIESTPELGTVCEIQLKYKSIAVTKQIAIENETALEYDLKGKTILVVEDNAMNQMVIKMITKKWLNTSVDFANNGEEGLKKLTENHYDIILMDLQMPVMDGYEATIAIRKGDAGEHKKGIPIIALTADVMESTKTRVIEIGMNKYLSKPVDKDTLFEIVKLLVN